jgi:DNA mismatch repair ATPase MutS
LNENEKVENFHMKTIQNGENSDDFTYTYSLEEGISEVRGGMKVLKDMDYPDEILRGAPPP